jgi:PEP-CTERM putative exosortase interaction domain
MWDDLSSGTVSNLGNLSINTISWLDSNSVSFATARPDASFTVSQLGQDVLLVYTAVPEPSTLVMLPAAGLALIGLRQLRRRKTARSTGHVTA